MVKSKYLYILIAVAIAGCILFFIFYESEKDQVKKRFKAFAKTATVKQGENPIIVASKCKKLSTFFAPVCRIEADEYNVSRDYSQKDIHTLAIRVLSRHEEFRVAFMDLRVNISEKSVADTVTTAQITGKLKGGEDYLEENHEVECRLKKIKDEWVFVKMRLIDVLQK